MHAGLHLSLMDESCFVSETSAPQLRHQSHQFQQCQQTLLGGQALSSEAAVWSSSSQQQQQWQQQCAALGGPAGVTGLRSNRLHQALDGPPKAGMSAFSPGYSEPSGMETHAANGHSTLPLSAGSLMLSNPFLNA